MEPFEVWLVERIDHVDKRLKKEFRLIDLTVRETLLLVLSMYRKIHKPSGNQSHQGNGPNGGL